MPAWAQILVAFGGCAFIFFLGFGCGKWGWPAGPRPATPDPAVTERHLYDVAGHRGDTACMVECATCHTAEWVEVDATSNTAIIAAAERWYARHRKEAHQ